MAQYLVDQLKGKGNVIMVTGVAGTFADTSETRVRKLCSRRTQESRLLPSTAATGFR